MAKRKAAGKATDAAPRAKRVSKDGLQANDAFANMAARMGAGTPSLAEATEYPLVRISNDYQLMLSLYRNHWISRRIVDEPAKDMVQAWPKITSPMTPEDVKLFDRHLARTGTKAAILRSLKWSRLFGGAGALMVIDGHEDMLDQPLDWDTINPGSYRGLIPFDRWSGITPTVGISSDIDFPLQFGLPESYRIQAGYGGKSLFEVHSSRILRFCGPEVPNPELQAQSNWGISVLEPAFEELRKRDNMSWSILQLAFRAQVFTQKSDVLEQQLSGAGASQMMLNRFWQRMQVQNQLLSNQSMLIVPKDGDLSSHQYSFGGLADIYSLFQMDTAGAADMTVSWLFGRTATGLGQSNEFDVQYRNDKVKALQEDNLRPALEKLYPVIMLSEFGEVPEDMDLDFPAVTSMSQKEKVEMVKSGTDAVLAPFTAGVYSQQTALVRLRHLDEMLELPPSISDEMIEKADDSVQAMGDLSLGDGDLDQEKENADKSQSSQEGSKGPTAE